jgi:hypothetical protein
MVNFVADHGSVFSNCNDSRILKVDANFSGYTIILVEGLFSHVQIGIVLVPQFPATVSVANQKHISVFVVTHV